MPDPAQSDMDLDRAANAMCGWLLENVHDMRAHEALCELHEDTWKEAAEVAVRAARHEFDCRPFTMRPELRDA